jgi:hypothetical protein
MPGPGYGGFGPSAPPSNYLAWAILSTIFCCLPAGIVAIVFAAQVNGKWMAGDVQGALSSSRNAKIWTIISASVFLVLAVAFVIVDVAFISHVHAIVQQQDTYTP